MSSAVKARIVQAISLLLVLLFVYAAAGKWMDFAHFQVEVGQSPVISRYRNWIVWVVPGAELVIAGLLLFPVTQLTALHLSLGTMFVFSGYIVLITQFSPFTPCACGGVIGKLNWNQHLVFNLAFVLLSAIAIVLHDSTSFVAINQGKPKT